MQLSKSSGSSFWQILGSLVENFNTEVFLIAVYHGNTKPADVNEYLKYFVEDALDVINNGIAYRSKIIKVEFNAFVCDAPTDTYLYYESKIINKDIYYSYYYYYITCVKNHTGYFSCIKCIQEGDYVERGVVFLENSARFETGSRRNIIVVPLF